MSMDAVALLRIANLPAPRTAFGAEYLVQHRGDASLLHTFARFHGTAADEHALALRQLLGPTLDGHDDPRGILFFSDVCEPRATSYDAIVREVSSAGVWAPKVDANHVPARYASAAANTHEALVSQMVGVMGRDPATQLDMVAQVNLLVLESTGGRADAVEGYREQIERLTRTMGAAFAGLYEKSLRKKIEQDRAAQGAHLERSQKLFARAQEGAPLFKPGDVDKLADNDLAKTISSALQDDKKKG